MSKGTAHRSIRCEDELWDAAKTKAKENDENLSEVIREALRSYVQTPPRTPNKGLRLPS